MKWIKDLFGIEDQSRLIEDKFNRLQDKIMVEVATLRSENIALKTEINQKNAKITDLLTKVRDQNEADLLLEMKKIEKRILEGEKRFEINLSNYNALQNMNAAYHRIQRDLGSLSGLIGRAF